MRCRSCKENMKKTQQRYNYVESGLDNVYLKEIDVFVCDSCDKKVPAIPSIKELHRAIAVAFLIYPFPLTGPMVRFLRKQMRFKSKDFARLLGVSPQTVSSWERQQTKIKKPNDRLIRVTCILKLCEDREFYERLKIDPYLQELSKIEDIRREEHEEIRVTTGPGVYSPIYHAEIVPTTT